MSFQTASSVVSSSPFVLSSKRTAPQASSLPTSPSELSAAPAAPEAPAPLITTTIAAAAAAAAAAAKLPLPLPTCGKGKVTFGTCGWSDHSAPWNNRGKSASGLQHHSFGNDFGCVEVDSTCYNYPRMSTIKAWINSTPKFFLFHVKLFGFLCSRGGSVQSLPSSVRSLLNVKTGWISDKEMPPAAKQLLWKMSNEMLTPLIRQNKMGVVVLQFHLNFHPNGENREYIRRCRRNLRGDVRMAIEFRDRSWLRGNERKKTTLNLLKSIGCGLVASDDLEHEVKQRDRSQRGLQPGQTRVRLRPVIETICQPEFLYCRVHRRHGTNRLLQPDSLKDWAEILTMLENDDCYIYFLCGTDYSDQPIVNCQRLKELLPSSMQLHWQKELLKHNRLLSMFSSSNKKTSSSFPVSTSSSSSYNSTYFSSNQIEKSIRKNEMGMITSMFQRNVASGTPTTTGGEKRKKKVFRYSIGGSKKKKREQGLSNFFTQKIPGVKK
jgi:uncharacterized protein YecE (DUF72 family)